jgi:hypothetical protein
MIRRSGRAVDGGDPDIAATLPDPEAEEPDETAAARPLVLVLDPAGDGVCDSACVLPPATGTEGDDPIADERPDSLSRLSRSNSDFISTACW